MSSVGVLLLVRIIHIVAGVIWAGAAFMVVFAIDPIASRYGSEGAGRWIGMIGRRAGPLSIIGAFLTIASGIYLFAALHAHDETTGGLVLKIGTVAALLALAIGFIVSRPAGLQLARLTERIQAGAVPAAQHSHELQRLSARMRWGARLMAALLGIAVVSMAAFRNVVAL
jgi:uncharacterized membrane protein